MGANEHCVAGKQPSQRVQLVTNEAAQPNSDSLLRDAMRAAAFARRLALLDIAARHAAAWHRSHYDPNQPRVPAGNPDGGQWTSTGAGSGAAVRVAQADHPRKTPPQIPQRPSSRGIRNEIIRHVIEWLSNHSDLVIEAGNWLLELYPAIKSSFDPPKTLKELHDAVANPQPGYDIHHIVEQNSAEEDGFPRSIIDAPDNLVRIPRFKHWDITGWYMSKNKDYDGHSPREYLRGKPWRERRRVGLDALIQHGVLKP